MRRHRQHMGILTQCLDFSNLNLFCTSICMYTEYDTGVLLRWQFGRLTKNLSKEARRSRYQTFWWFPRFITTWLRNKRALVMVKYEYVSCCSQVSCKWALCIYISVQTDTRLCVQTFWPVNEICVLTTLMLAYLSNEEAWNLRSYFRRYKFSFRGLRIV